MKTNSGNFWKDSEIEFLKDNWLELTSADIAEKLRRTNQSVNAKALRIGLRPQSVYKIFITKKDLGELLGVSQEQIRYWIKKNMIVSKKLGFNSKNSTTVFYEKDIISFLENNLDKWDGTKVANYFTYHLTSKKIKNKIEHDKEKGFVKRGKRYTEKDHQQMISLYRKGFSCRKIAEKIGRTYKSVNNRLCGTDIFGTGEFVGVKNKFAKKGETID